MPYMISWDKIGERLYETGVDRGVLYPQSAGVYPKGVAWNGLTNVNESPTGAEPNPLYADNIKYLNLLSVEEFEATIEAFTYPDEFSECDGSATLVPGVQIGQQPRKTFGMAYRTVLGNDLELNNYGYKLHLVYGAMAAPSDKSYETINDSPDAITFSWEITTTPVNVTGHKPTASLVIDSTTVEPAKLAALEAILYGSSSGVDGRLPLPDEVLSIIGENAVMVAAITPTFDAETGVIYVPFVEGVQYKVSGVNADPGEQDPISAGTTATVTATNKVGFVLALGPTTWKFTADE